MRKAVVRQSDGLVVNVILADDGWVPPDGHLLLDAQDGGPGDRWDGARFIKLPPPPPKGDPDRAAFLSGTVAERFLILAKRLGVV